MGTDIAAGCDVDPKMKRGKVGGELIRNGWDRGTIGRDWRSRQVGRQATGTQTDRLLSQTDRQTDRPTDRQLVKKESR